MKSYIAPALTILCVIIGTYSVTKKQSEKLYEKIQIEKANFVGRERYFKFLFDFALNNMGQKFPVYEVRHKTDIISSDQIITYPGLLICIPETENVCMSCVDYAINSVREAFTDFEKNQSIGIVSFGYNIDLKERIIKKEIFYVNKNDSVNLFSQNPSTPFYLVIDEQRQIISSFVPNADIPNLTQTFLEKVQVYLMH